MKKYTEKELAEAQIAPSGFKPSQVQKNDEDFSAFRLKRMSQSTEGERAYSKLLQLKYTIESYVNGGLYNKEYTFGYFLKEYIHSFHKSKNAFSDEISLHHTKLSRLLNDRDSPNENVFVRLELHSNSFISALLWYRVVEKQKEMQLMENGDLRIEQNKFVKKRLELS